MYPWTLPQKRYSKCKKIGFYKKNTPNIILMKWIGNLCENWQFFLKISVNEQAELQIQTEQFWHARWMASTCFAAAKQTKRSPSLTSSLLSVVWLKVSYRGTISVSFQSYKGKGEIKSKGTYRGIFWIRANLPQIHFFIKT